MENNLYVNTDINWYIEKYPEAKFTAIAEEDLDLQDFLMLQTVDELVTESKKLNYLHKSFHGIDATNYIMKLIISGYIKGTTDALFNKLESEKTIYDNEAVQYQLSLLQTIGDALYTKDSDDSLQLRNLCSCAKFEQLILLDNYSGRVVFLEDTDLTMDRFSLAVELVEKIFTRIFSALLLEDEQKLRAQLESEPRQKTYVS